MTDRESPYHYEQKAERYLALGEYELAIAAINSARAVTLGHSKRQQFDALAEMISTKHGVERHHNMLRQYAGRENY